MNQKRQSVVKKVISRLSVAMILINILAIILVQTIAQRSMKEAETKYLTEVVSNIATTIDTTMHEYMMAVEIIAKNRNVITIMDESNKTSPMISHERTPEMLEEMTEIVNTFQGNVEIIALIDMDQDAYLMHDGTASGASDTVTTRPYYESITSQKTIVTEPYAHATTGTMVVSVASPVYSGKGELLGCITLNLPTSFLAKLIYEFGDSGNTWVVDENNNVLAHTNTSYIGKSYKDVGITGNEIDSQMTNPTGALIEFDLSGTSRIGSIGNIPSLGWKMVAGMNVSEFYEASNFLAVALIVIQTISVFCALGVCAWAVYSRLRPLKDLNIAMTEMSKGNLQHQLLFESDDEIGELSENLRCTMANMSNYIHEIHQNLSAFGSGDFTRTSDLVFLGDFREIQNSTEEFVSLITSTLESLRDTVEQVSVGSDYVASGSQSLAAGSAKQSESISDLNQFILHITNQIQENARTVDSVNRKAQDIATELQASNKQLDMMMSAIDDIQVTSDGITKVIKTVEDVAFQTNILALNASVEAARAGTSGRGFAVVADEVRKLSHQTSDAVKNTTALISESLEAVKRGNQIASSTTESLKNVTQDITGFIQHLDAITEASQEQAMAIEKISSGVGEIATVMQSNSAVSEESAATSEELSSQASVMKGAIEQFRLS